VGHLHLVPEIEGPRDAGILVDAQDFAKIRRSVTEYGQVLAHSLLQEAKNKCFGQAQFQRGRQATRFERLGEPARGGNRLSPCRNGLAYRACTARSAGFGNRPRVQSC